MRLRRMIIFIPVNRASPPGTVYMTSLHRDPAYPLPRSWLTMLANCSYKRSFFEQTKLLFTQISASYKQALSKKMQDRVLQIGVSSKTEGIDVGVPQGSYLGPLLFLTYINDLPQAVQNSTVSMHADDTSLCYQSSDIDQLNEAINNDLKQLDIWLQGNKLSLNVAKTNSMLVATKQKHNILNSRNDDLDLKIRDNDLEIIQETKYLGVQIDNSLNWKEHIKIVSTKVSRAIGFLKHAKTILGQETLKILYTGIVEPHFRYCCSVWGCAGSTELNQLQKLQNRAAQL